MTADVEMAGAPVICVAPAPAIDRLEEVEELRPGAIHRPVAVTAVPGGKGLNVARAAASLGANVTAVGFLAGHAGRWIEAALALRQVRGRFVWVEGETRTCVSVLDRKSLELTEFFEPGPPVPERAWQQLLAVLGDLLQPPAPAQAAVQDRDATEHEGPTDTPVVTISGGLPPGAPDDAFARVVRLAHERGARVLVDAYGAGLARALDERPELVKVNASEAATALAAPEASDLAMLAEGLRGAGANAAVVTDGPRGSILRDVAGRMRLPPPRHLGHYPTGSGDAFLAGVAAGLAAGQDLRDAVTLGAGTAAASALVPGAGELDPRTAHEFAVDVAASATTEATSLDDPPATTSPAAR